MSTYAPQHGMTLTEACALVVGILRHPTTTEVHRFLAADGWEVSRDIVNSTLRYLRRGPVDIAVQGRPGGWGPHTRWRLTEAGRAWIAGDERCEA